MNPPKFIMSTSVIMSLIMTLLVFQCRQDDESAEPSYRAPQAMQRRLSAEQSSSILMPQRVRATQKTEATLTH